MTSNAKEMQFGFCCFASGVESNEELGGYLRASGSRGPLTTPEWSRAMYGARTLSEMVVQAYSPNVIRNTDTVRDDVGRGAVKRCVADHA
jgi:hypothetical protein